MCCSKAMMIRNTPHVIEGWVHHVNLYLNKIQYFDTYSAIHYMYQSTYSSLHRVLVPHPSSETADNTEVFYHHLLGPLWNSFPSSLVPTMGITSLDVTKDRLDAEIKKQFRRLKILTCSLLLAESMNFRPLNLKTVGSHRIIFIK